MSAPFDEQSPEALEALSKLAAVTVDTSAVKEVPRD